MSDDINARLTVLENLVKEVLAKLSSISSSTGNEGQVNLAYPNDQGVTEVAGMKLMLDEPIAADWEPSQLYRTLYTSNIGAKEISNAPFDGSLPKRSPKYKYPMVYTGKRADGSLDPKSGRIAFADQTFATEDELMAWRAARDKQTQTLKDLGHKFSPGPGGTQPPPPTEVPIEQQSKKK